jgi:hypothetical protein
LNAQRSQNERPHAVSQKISSLRSQAHFWQQRWSHVSQKQVVRGRSHRRCVAACDEERREEQTGHRHG